MARKPILIPVPFEEPEEHECPKCPPPGAPAWMATFADIATLLMAFFVLILSFAEFNQPKFKMVAGSLKNSFGVQRQVPVFEQPKGTTVIEMNFSPSPQPSPTKEMTQDTTQTEAPKIKTPASEEDSDAQDSKEKDNDKQSDAGDGGTMAASELAQALQEALGDGSINAEIRNGEVVMQFPPSDQETMLDQLQSASDALKQAMETSGKPIDDVLVQGLAEKIDQLAALAENEAEAQEARIAEGRAERAAALAEAELRVALRQELDQGLVTVEQREDKVVVVVGAGGAFPSGVADLTPQAQDIMARLAFSAMGEASEIVVTGHTDSVPLSGGSPFRDNWGLAAARASSVVRELSGSGLVAPDRLTATSRGETMPVKSNDSAEGREENRRIEIEINY